MTLNTEAERQQHEAVDRVQSWRDRLGTGLVLVIDTETTGLSGVVFEFTARDLKTGNVVLSFMCNTGEAVWENTAAMMHDDRIKTVAAMPAPVLYLPVLQELLEGVYLLAFNAKFDLAAMIRTWPDLVRLGLSDMTDCVMETYAALNAEFSESKGTYRYVSFKAACQRAGIDRPHIHDSPNDTLSLVELIKTML